jgi:large subunit ribosomal protein L14e
VSQHKEPQDVRKLPTIEIGRVCVKLSGRETGLKFVILDVIDKNFALVTGPKEVNKMRRRRVNVKHLEPTTLKIDLEKGASDQRVMVALKDMNLIEEMARPIRPAKT